ncbi:hypothetical protein M407DRAFT_161470 [Tulasnella calospora MUT 4182]|uniref:UBX domain-containing protein n=1 Tax=Tulasnella calospora MUT 4182 TaxID=1051891 RepID=A0A0C3QP31_9AGAM|nr:hypothetical protein M407DRAFT_161470 [Tulasnella calospora MUT 4182]
MTSESVQRRLRETKRCAKGGNTFPANRRPLHRQPLPSLHLWPQSPKEAGTRLPGCRSDCPLKAPPLITTLRSDNQLRTVAEFVAGQPLAYKVDTVSFTMQFPRKTFTHAEMNKNLRDLGLTPFRSPHRLLIAEAGFFHRSPQNARYDVGRQTWETPRLS